MCSKFFPILEYLLSISKSPLKRIYKTETCNFILFLKKEDTLCQTSESYPHVFGFTNYFLFRGGLEIFRSKTFWTLCGYVNNHGVKFKLWILKVIYHDSIVAMSRVLNSNCTRIQRGSQVSGKIFD